MKLTILGTGNAQAVACYNTCFALSEENRHFLVDGGGGNGLLRQLAAAGIDWRDIRDIYVTHKHIDHILGIIWMMRMILQNMKQGSYDGEARIFGHEEVIRLLRQFAVELLPANQTKFIDDRLHMIIVEDGGTFEVLGRKVTAFDIGSTKAKQFGFCMELGDGKRLTCCGDEPYSERERPYADHCTWLLHEAFCLHGQADIFHPYEKHHSTVADAAKLAEELCAENLILYHTEDHCLDRRRELYSAEAEKFYHGNLCVPDDLDQIEIC